jgi:nitrogen fixation protein
MSQDNININIEETNDIINIVSSEVTELIDINIGETVEEVTLNITEEIIQVNINKITGGGGNQTLAETLVFGNQTDGTDIFLNNEDSLLLENTSSLKKGTYNFGGNGGISRVCSNNYEDMWQDGFRHVFDQSGFIRNSTNCFNIVPDVSFDVTLRFKIGSIWTLDNGTNYICTDATEGAAVWELYNVIPTNTSDLTNDSNFVSDASYVHTDNNFTTAEQTKLAGIEAGAEVNVNADWNATSGDAQILNKPTIPSLTGYVPYTGATADLDLGTYNLTADHIALNVSPSGAGFVVGATEWNNTIGSSQTLLKGGNVTLKNGVDLVARIVNKVTPNTTLTKAAYQVVKVTGAQGQRLAVDLAQANNDNNSADTLGVVTETIATNQEGFILTVGQIENINTTGSLQGETWADGDVLYLSTTTAGKMTNVKPTGATGHIVVLGYVEYAHSSQGKIYVKIMNGWELDELHNVYISSVADKQLLSYDSATSLWKNKSVTTADIADSTNKRYVTDANLTTIGNQSGTNTGDETATTIKSKLGITTLSGSNTGDQDLSSFVDTLQAVLSSQVFS